MLAAVFLLLALAFGAGPAIAFDMLDVRLLRDSGYRWCRGCDLREVQFQDANLRSAELQDANLIGAQLQNADLFGAQLQDANLTLAKLQNADLRHAQLQNANLRAAVLQDANLRRAQLQNAILDDASVDGAKLAFANLTKATYGPASPPPDSHVEGIQGLDTLLVPYDVVTEQSLVSGLVSLRELLQNAGLRDLERKATFSIEWAKTHHALDRWRERPLRAVEAVFRLIFFEWPVAYGLDPWRAFQILLGLMLLLSFAYLPWIGHTRRARTRRGAIYRIWPNERVVDDRGNVRLLTYGDVPERKRAERLEAKGILGRYGYALYFSLLSAFHIGWRELSIGTWLSRLQREEYALRAQGWPRRISGMQSLISVYLVAIWALTYFGRPFQ
jgi:Pentapeptide repeats (8 copies)